MPFEAEQHAVPSGRLCCFFRNIQDGDFYFFIKKATTAILSVINNSIVYCGVHRIVLLDHIQEDMNRLSSMPADSHIGQIDISWLKEDLPEQFLMKYDYEFLFQMKCKLHQLRGVAKHSQHMSVHSVLEEILIYLRNEEAKALIELFDVIDIDEMEEWIFDFFDDMDVMTYLYSGLYLDENHIYHFSHWADERF